MIRYFNGPCGSGKTFEAIKLASALIQKKMRVLFVSPSTDLQYEISTRLGKTPHKIINYMESENGVSSTIEKYLNHPTFHEVLIITHAAFKSIQHFPNKKDWTVFLDEEIDPLEYIYLDMNEAGNYAYGNNIIEDMQKICTFKIHDEGYTSIRKKYLSKEDKSFLKSITFSGKQGQFVYPPFQKFIQLLLNSNMRLYADTTSMVAFKLGNTEMELWSELDIDLFKGFKDLYLMGAQIQRSKLCTYFKLKGLQIVEANMPKRFDSHDQPITIKWMSKHSPWSKAYYNTPNEIDNTVTNFELFDLLVSNSIGNEYILIQTNKGNPFKHIQKPIQMSYEVKGLNQYSNYLHYVEAGAYLMPPACHKKMADLGFDVEEMQLHSTLSHAYQGLMRTNLRNGEFSNNIIYLPTEQMALNMRNIYFPNAKVERVESAEQFFLK